ncbi:MAG: Lipid A export ATP-binding/permease protein MsbA [Alphaproteobacteria bacterium MarineAlpha3_Bin5]|nr:hypothetical protein [Magnetovibrio sp.]PPR79823.1 MAG: Lipid A export ATP-binding/permease protein MsbA [Alphaproteobacteria bacterium MarineAlpha3_Bin5]
MSNEINSSIIAILGKTLALINPSMRRTGICLAVLMVIGVFMETLGIGLVFPLITVISEPNVLAGNELASMVFGEIDETNRTLILTVLVIGFFFVIALKNGLLLLIATSQARFFTRNEALLSARLFGRYLNADYRLHLTRSSADLVNHVVSTTTSVSSHAMQGLLTLGSESLVILFVVSVLFMASPLITIGAVVLIAPAAALIYFAVRNRLVTWGRISVETRQRVLQLVQQGLHSIKEVTIFGRQPFILGEYEQARKQLADLDAKVRIVSNVPRLWIETIIVGAVVLGIVVSIQRDMEIGNLFSAMALFAAATFRLVPSCNRILMALNSIRGGTYPVNKIHTELHKTAFASASNDVTQSAPPFRNSITLERVSFSYPETDTAAISDINLTIYMGETVGLAGASGAGKTTLADILLGLLKPQQGRILFDDADARDHTTAWQRSLGYVPQSVYLIDDTLRRNIAFCLPDSQIDEGRVRRVLRNAQLEAFVNSLPQGLDTSVGDRGVRLSGGQKQRIGIARALYEDRQLLVLDEATSSLDTQAEQEIGIAIDKLSGKRTIVIIAHRLSTLRQCDRIVYIEDGRIIDTAPFDELAARNAAFRKSLELSKL